MYTVYKVTNLQTKEYYIGVHKTNNPMDSYMGSGLKIRRAIQKYGLSSFQKEIIEQYAEKEPAYSQEKLLLDSALKDPLCYNLKEGGIGGFDYIHKHPPKVNVMQTPEGLQRFKKALEQKLSIDPDFWKRRNLKTLVSHPNRFHKKIVSLGGLDQVKIELERLELQHNERMQEVRRANLAARQAEKLTKEQRRAYLSENLKKARAAKRKELRIETSKALSAKSLRVWQMKREEIRDAMSDTYEIVDPNGNKYITNRLTEFCKCHSIPYTALWLMARNGKSPKWGKAVGWICHKKV